MKRKFIGVLLVLVLIFLHEIFKTHIPETWLEDFTWMMGVGTGMVMADFILNSK